MGLISGILSVLSSGLESEELPRGRPYYFAVGIGISKSIYKKHLSAAKKIY